MAKTIFLSALTVALVIIGVIAVPGCAGSPAALMSHPQKKAVRVNGVEYHVSPVRANVYASFRPHRMALLTYTMTALYTEKAAHIRAVELATGCKVIDAEFVNPPSLYATVDCTRSPSTHGGH